MWTADAAVKINVHALLALSRVNGPGKRGVVWFQGCPFNCPGCFNQAARRRDTVRPMTATEILDGLAQTEIEGITVSGGEPFLQAAGLRALCRAAGKRGWSLMLYSGYTLAQLKARGCGDTDEVLALADILVDGPYQQDLPPVSPWCGSGNQQVHFLSDRYAHLAGRPQAVLCERYMEYQIDAAGDLIVTGF